MGLRDQRGQASAERAAGLPEGGEGKHSPLGTGAVAGCVTWNAPGLRAYRQLVRADDSPQGSHQRAGGTSEEDVQHVQQGQREPQEQPGDRVLPWRRPGGREDNGQGPHQHPRIRSEGGAVDAQGQGQRCTLADEHRPLRERHLRHPCALALVTSRSIVRDRSKEPHAQRAGVRALPVADGVLPEGHRGRHAPTVRPVEEHTRGDGHAEKGVRGGPDKQLQRLLPWRIRQRKVLLHELLRTQQLRQRRHDLHHRQGLLLRGPLLGDTRGVGRTRRNLPQVGTSGGLERAWHVVQYLLGHGPVAQQVGRPERRLHRPGLRPVRHTDHLEASGRMGLGQRQHHHPDPEGLLPELAAVGQASGVRRPVRLHQHGHSAPA